MYLTYGYEKQTDEKQHGSTDLGQAGRIRLVLSLKHELSRAAGREEAVPEEDAQNLMMKEGISTTPDSCPVLHESLIGIQAVLEHKFSV